MSAKSVILVAIVALIIGIGIGYFATPYLSPVISGRVENLDRPSVVPQVQGWYKGNDVLYWDFGTNPPIAAPILVFFQSDSPDTPVAGQQNIINVIPGEPGYTDFWRVYKVLAPTNYAANSIKSFDDALDSGYTIQETNIVVNCPVVNPSATLENSQKQLVQGWYRNREVFYFDFGSNSPANGFIVQTAPIYALFYPDGNPVSGQRNIIDVVIGEQGYSDLWLVTKVTVPASYVANTYKSVTDIQAAAASGAVTTEITDIYVNCPL